MKRLISPTFCFALLALPGLGQITEPPRGNLSQEDYMTQLLDSLAFAQHAKDTTNIIRYTAVLTTQFQTGRMTDRAISYLNVALQHASSYSDHSFYGDVCNRAGMLTLTATFGPLGPARDKILDSCRYWHRKAIHHGLQSGKLVTAGWGYYGLLQNATFNYNNKHVRDSIPIYYRNAVQFGTQTNDVELIVSCGLQYSIYLYQVKDIQGTDSVLRAQLQYLDRMTPMMKVVFYFSVHDHLARANNLDTLRRLRILERENYNFVVAARHKEELYSKDQQYEVSKTRNILDATTSRLDATNRVLVYSSIALVLFAALLAYLFFLFRKNKKLSVRNELLLREQNHRVKNNLQMISSLLSLQSQRLVSIDARNALEESNRRINSVALLHRMLYEGPNVGEVDVTSYIRSLTEEIQYSAGRNMKIEQELPQTLKLKIEKVTSLGLIVNELVTNSIKHVDKSISLLVTLSIHFSEGKFHMVYTDNGAGIPTQEWTSADSFGNQLVRIQSQQLRGQYDIASGSGFRYELKALV